MSRFSVTVSRSIGMVLGPLYTSLRKDDAARCSARGRGDYGPIVRPLMIRPPGPAWASRSLAIPPIYLEALCPSSRRRPTPPRRPRACGNRPPGAFCSTGRFAGSELLPMSTPQQTYTPFNEQAALDELERLQQALEESRQRRKDASAAFDQFVNSFRKEPARDHRGERATWPRTDVGPSIIAREGRIAPPSIPARSRRRISSPGILAGAIVVTVVAISIGLTWRSAPAESTAPPAISTAAGSVPTPVPASMPAASEPSAATGSQSELRALAHVWVRATVDGRRIVERELNAGDRVPLNGRTIVIRAGDATAVRVIVDGQDRGTVGETPIAVTRTYTSSSAAR